MPAAFTRIPSGPSCPTAAPTAASTSLHRLTSACTKVALPPAPLIRLTASLPPSGMRSTTATGAPAAASASAMARPIPDPPPVTTAQPSTSFMEPSGISCRESYHRVRRGLLRERHHGVVHRPHDLGHAVVVERVGGVPRRVIPVIAIEGGVGDHHRPVAVGPEAAVVGKVDAGDPRGRGDGSDVEVGRALHRLLDLPHERALSDTADHRDEVTRGRSEEHT